MITDTERREVARRLREVKKTCFDFTWCKICMGVCGPECPVGCDEDEMAVDVAKRLADLIEPSCDRDALLALVDEMDMDASCYAYVDDYNVNVYARRIREALGE